MNAPEKLKLRIKLPAGGGRLDEYRLRGPANFTLLGKPAFNRVALAACARSGDDYLEVYARVLAQVREPVILHWLGEMFDPALAGYWGHADHGPAMEVALAVLRANAAKIDGIKISLLDKDKEIAM